MLWVQGRPQERLVSGRVSVMLCLLSRQRLPHIADRVSALSRLSRRLYDNITQVPLTSDGQRYAISKLTETYIIQGTEVWKTNVSDVPSARVIGLFMSFSLTAQAAASAVVTPVSASRRRSLPFTCKYASRDLVSMVMPSVVRHICFAYWRVHVGLVECDWFYFPSFDYCEVRMWLPVSCCTHTCSVWKCKFIFIW